MDDLLFLSHRMPFPPEKGDKIRSWHILRHLAQRYRVHLGCFYDDPADERHVATLAEICATACCLPLDPRTARIRSLAALASGEALSAAYFHDARLMRWIAETFARHRPRHAFVFCSAMVPYLDKYRFDVRALDLVDVDSEKWRQYAEKSRFPMSAIYRREAATLLALETRAARNFDYTLLSSAAEARLFARRAGDDVGAVLAMRNGVDHDFFKPGNDYPCPYPAGRRRIVFTGAMDYRPNIDAALWFAGEVMPLLRAAGLAVDFWIVGAHPASALLAAQTSDVHVTGRVDDMRPYLAHADVVVAPLRIARGIQNKVLEGMAMARPVIATADALEGLDVAVGSEVLVATTAADFVAAIGAVFDGAANGLGASARARIESGYGWPAALRVLDDIFADMVPALASAS
jgi:sugar transferase (PEP-CTERM/EpsH1 system associated)